MEYSIQGHEVTQEEEETEMKIMDCTKCSQHIAGANGKSVKVKSDSSRGSDE
jgi:hypothetical protein